LCPCILLSRLSGLLVSQANYLVAFGKPAGHREVAPREFDAHALGGSPRGSRREKKEKKKKIRRMRKEDEDKTVKRKRLV
jgi:hypothetical protein